MANDKLKHEDDPPGSTLPLQWIKETEIPVKSNEATNFRNVLNNMHTAGADDTTMQCMTAPLSLFPYGDLNRIPNPYAQEMPLTGIQLLTDLTPLSDSEYPIFDHLFGGSHTPIPPSPGSDFLGMEGQETEFRHTRAYSVPRGNVMSAMLDVNLLQEPYAGRNLLITAQQNSASAVESIQLGEEINSNTDRPQLFRNYLNDRVNKRGLFQTLADADISRKNKFIISGAHKDCPEKVDASFLSLGIGQKTDDLDTSNIQRRKVTHNFERVVLPQSNTFHGQKADRSSLTPSAALAAGLPCLQNNGGGLNVIKNSILKGEMQLPPFMPGNGNPSLGFEGNKHTISAYNSFQGYQAVSLIPVGSSLSGHDSAQSQATGVPFNASTGTCLSVSGATNNLFSDSSTIYPLIGVPRSTSLHDHSGNPFTVNEGIAVQVAERGHVPKQFTFSQLPGNYCRPRVIAADQSSTNLSRCVITGGVSIPELNRTAQSSSTFVGTSLKRVAAEPPAETSRTQRKRKTQSSASSAPTLSPNLLSLPSLSVAPSSAGVAPIAPSFQHQTESVISMPPLSKTSMSLPSQTIVTPSFPPLSQSSPFLPPLAKNTISRAPRPQKAPSLRPRAKTTSSLPAISQNSPSLLPQPQTSPLPLPSPPGTALPLPQKSQIASPLSKKSQTASPLPLKPKTASPLPPKPKTASSLPLAAKIVPPVQPKPQAAPAAYIKWNGFSETQPMEHKCLLCKRAISFTEGGPVSVPIVAVLPCGHAFHDHCLQLITPDDQMKNPPCIPCAVGESLL